MTRILGVSAHFHDAAACLLEDGRLVCAAEEERFTRRKHDRRIPRQAARFCLDFGGVRIDEIDAVAYYERPLLKLERQRWMLAQAPEGAFAGAAPAGAGRAAREIRRALAFDGPIEWVAHHEAHAASAYLFSGFETAAVLCRRRRGRVGDDELRARAPAGSISRKCASHSLGLFLQHLTELPGLRGETTARP
jgi:carbamoyltransferase